MTSVMAALPSSRSAYIYHVWLSSSGICHGVIAGIDISSGFGDDDDRIEAGMTEMRSEYWIITQ